MTSVHPMYICMRSKADCLLVTFLWLSVDGVFFAEVVGATSSSDLIRRDGSSPAGMRCRLRVVRCQRHNEVSVLRLALLTACIRAARRHTGTLYRPIGPQPGLALRFFQSTTTMGRNILSVADGVQARERASERSGVLNDDCWRQRWFCGDLPRH